MSGQKTAPLESTLERQACLWISQELGVINSKFNTTSDTGYPDRIFWVPGGKPVLIEFKRPGGKVSPKQKYQIDRLRKLGYRVEVCTNAKDAYKAVKEELDAAQVSRRGS